MSEQESWATRTVSAHLGNDWYGTAEAVVESLAEEQDENPFVGLAERLREYIEDGLLATRCPEEFCRHSYKIDGVAKAIVLGFLDDVDWDVIAREYEDDLVREGGVRVSDYEWAWDDDVDGGECDD